MTIAEFFVWNPPGPYLWQLVDGEPQQMAMVNRTHGSLLSEIGSLVANHLDKRSSPCCVITMPGIIPRLLLEINIRVADLAATCTSYETEESALTDQVLVMEILSPNNQAVTWPNVRTYTTIPSVREILVLKTVSIGAELLRRNVDGFWPSPPLSIDAGELRLESIDFSIPSPPPIGRRGWRRRNSKTPLKRTSAIRGMRCHVSGKDGRIAKRAKAPLSRADQSRAAGFDR
jgi:Uma2 family endonuclease